MACIQAFVLVGQTIKPIEARPSNAAQVSYLSEEVAAKLGVATDVESTPTVLRGMGGEPFSCAKSATLTFLLGDFHETIKFVVTPGDLNTLILGLNWFIKRNLQIHFGSKGHCEITDDRGSKHTVPLIQSKLGVLLMPGATVVSGPAI